MYKERKDNFSIRDIVLQILFVVIFIFILMWLFPSKQFVKDSLTPLYDRIFNENILMMKDAAKSYYTDPRLPQKVGDKVKMTLGEMENKKIILPFTDSKGRACDKNESYVQITKMDDEYIMKVNLKCTEQENYLLVYMGCYTYCKTTICEKNEKDIKTPTIIPAKKTATPKPTKVPTPTKTPTPTNKPTPKPKEYICKYVKTVNPSYTSWSSWSEWSTTTKYKDDLTDVQSEVRTTYTEEKVQIGTRKTTKTITYTDKNKPIYENRQVLIGYSTSKVCTQTTNQTVGTGKYKYEWVDANPVVLKSFKGSEEIPYTSTERWIFVRTTDTSCGNCSFGTYRVYKKQVSVKHEITETKQVCSKWEDKKTPNYITTKVLVGYGTSQREEVSYEPIYGIRKTPKNTTYYRYRTRKLNSGSRDEVWNTCDNKTLINNGYVWTGEKKEK